MPNFTLEGHEKGVNCVDYFSGGDRPYLASGADDKLVKVLAQTGLHGVCLEAAAAARLPPAGRPVCEWAFWWWGGSACGW